jgi:hypothetical protein
MLGTINSVSSVAYKVAEGTNSVFFNFTYINVAFDRYFDLMDKIL